VGPGTRSPTLSAAHGLRGRRRRRTAYEAVAAAVQLPAVGQVGAARQDQQRAVCQPGALQQLGLCKALHLRSRCCAVARRVCARRSTQESSQRPCSREFATASAGGRRRCSVKVPGVPPFPSVGCCWCGRGLSQAEQA